MNLIKESCQDWIRDVEAPPDLADRVLHTRSRRTTHRLAIPLAALATVLVVALAVALATRLGNDPTSAPAIPVPTGDTSLHTDPTHYQPRKLVAAGQMALAAYGTDFQSANPGNSETSLTWHVYDAAKDRYVTVPWANVKVAPGLKEAAVMEASGTRRIGLLDLTTMKVTRWLPSDRPVSSVDWSPDAGRLVLTDFAPTTVQGQTLNARTGFTIVDVATGHSTFQSLPVNPVTSGGSVDTMVLENLVYQAVSWSRSGRLVWAEAPDISGKRDYFDLHGKKATPPGHEGDQAVDSPLSPDGRLIATTGAAGYGAGPAVSITAVASGKRQAVVIVEHAVVWADDSHVIGLACDPKDCSGTGEFHNRLALAGLDGSLVPLTGAGNSQSKQAWTPQFVSRW